MQGHRHRELAYFALNSADRIPEAEKRFRAALQIFDALHTEFPDNTEYWHFLADTHRRLGRVLEATKRPDEAVSVYRLAIDLHEQRAAKFPDHPEYLAEWSLAYFDLGHQLAATGRTSEVDALFQKAVIGHSKGIKLSPNSWQVWSSRGEAYAELKDWNNAVTDFAKAVELAPQQPLLHYRHALVRLAGTDSKGYREACAGMFARFRTSADANARFWTVWTCALAPDAVANWQPVVDLAEKAVADDPKNYDKLLQLGAVLYNAGRLPEAVKRLEQAEAAFKEAKSARSSIAYLWQFQAMTEHSLGHFDEAKKRHQKAVREIDEPSSEEAKVANAAWNRRLTLQLLRREVEAMMTK
jgi:tetratricopeptide (TPR) repeat protein